MNNMTKFMAMLGAFGSNTAKPVERPAYPYAMGERHTRVGRSPSHTKKGPGRRHLQGVKRHD